MGDALGLGEDGREVVVVAGISSSHLAGIHILLILQIDRIIDRAERLVVEHLSRLDDQILSTIGQIFLASLHFLHRHHSLAALLHRMEIDHRGGLVRVVLQRLHRHLGKEGEGTL